MRSFLETSMKPGAQLTQIVALMTVFRDVSSETSVNKEEGAVKCLLFSPHIGLSSVFLKTQSVSCCHPVFTRCISKRMIIKSSSNRLSLCVPRKQSTASKCHLIRATKTKFTQTSCHSGAFRLQTEVSFDFSDEPSVQ